MADGRFGDWPTGMGRLRDLQPGSVLGRYELVLKVASGGMGEIWAARLTGSRGFQKVVAVKTLLPELSHNPNFEQMFLDEAALAAKIKHPNVVQVIDLGEEDQILYQVMEWVSGESLWSIMRAAAKREGIPLPVAARIVCQVCAGLHAAHELKGDDGQPMGLVHRDVSPQNILITAHGVAKVVDFGVAKYAGRGVAETKAGELRGKVPYMAPEHILGQPTDRRADVFALGLLMYQLVSGVHPFLEDDDRLTMARISSPLPAVPLRRRMTSVPEDVSQIVGAALSKLPNARTASAVELMRALEQAIPSCAVQSSNELVADYLREVVGEHLELRAQELRDALKRLDESDSEAAPAASKRGAGTIRTPALGTPIEGGLVGAVSRTAETLPPPRLTPVTLPAPTPVTEPSVTSGVSGLSNTLDLDEPEPLPVIVGWRGSWVGRHPWIAGGAALGLIVLGIVGLGAAAGSSSPAPSAPAGAEVTAKTPVAAPSVTVAVQPPAAPEPPPPPPIAAPTETAASTGYSRKTPVTAAIPPRPTPTERPVAPPPAPVAPPTSGRDARAPGETSGPPASPKGTSASKPKEFTPKGL